jgi:prepilin-type processing-associated H-X9-DG protein
MLAFLLAVNTLAATKPTEILKPYLDAHTCCIVEIDLTQTKPDQIAKWLEPILKESKAPKAAAALKSINGDLLKQAQKVSGELRKAGVKRIYYVASVADRRTDPFFFVIPLEGANEEAVMKTFPEATEQEGHEKIGEAIISGPPATLSRLQNVEPAEQEDLAKALETIGDAPLRAAVLVPPELRAEAGHAPVPQIKTIVDNLTWITAAAQLPPKPSFKLIGQCNDADAARSVATAVEELCAMANDNPEFDKMEALREQLQQIKPAVENDRITIAFDDAKLKTFTEAMVPAIIMARMDAMRAVSASNERQIVMAMMMHANDNNGAWPDDLKSLSGKYIQNKDVLKNPTGSGDEATYTYIKPSEAQTDTPASRMVVYETFDEFPEDGINVGYADGHVELVTTKDQFDDLLKDAKEKAAEKK